MNRQHVLFLLLVWTAAVFAQDSEQDSLQMANEQGYAYYHGEGVPQDYTSAAMWFKRAASRGYVKAEYNLAFCYMEGKGVPRDYEKALDWLLKAANGGYVQAQLTLAEGYEKGILVEQDMARSKYWQTRAENGGREPQQAAPAQQAPAPRIVYAPGYAPPKKVPVVRILYPEDQSLFHTDKVKVKYQLQADGLESSTKVVAYVDGEKIPDGRAVRQANMIDVDVPNRDCTIMLYAQNEAGNSEPATIRLIRENAGQVELPRLFAVVVGVGKYDDPQLPPLRLTTKDAHDFATTLMKKKGLPYADVQVKVLCDEEATRADMFEAMEWLRQEATPYDVCIFFYAGHGYRDEKDRFYFIPYGGSTDKLYNCFSASDFKLLADDINCKFIVFTDACYSAALLEGRRSAATAHFVEQLRRTKNGMMLYASSASDTKSVEDPSWGNGAFTKALVEAFNGGARRPEDEGLSTQALEMYLYRQVKKLTKGRQAPIFMNPNGMEHFNLFTYDE